MPNLPVSYLQQRGEKIVSQTSDGGTVDQATGNVTITTTTVTEKIIPAKQFLLDQQAKAAQLAKLQAIDPVAQAKAVEDARLAKIASLQAEVDASAATLTTVQSSISKVTP